MKIYKDKVSFYRMQNEAQSTTTVEVSGINTDSGITFEMPARDIESKENDYEVIEATAYKSFGYKANNNSNIINTNQEPYV